MKRRIGILFAVMAWLLLLAGPAGANHADLDFFYDQGAHQADTWNNSITENFCVSPDFDPLNSVEYANMKDTAENAFLRWKNNTDINSTIVLRDQPRCDSNFDFRAEAQDDQTIGEYCADLDSTAKSRIELEDLDWDDPTLVATTKDCDLNGNGVIDYFIIVFDADRDWKWGYDTLPATGQWDFLGVTMHEAGHALGFNGHFFGDACGDTDNTANVMCTPAPPGAVRPGGSAGQNGAWWRTLESHDIGETNQNY